MVRNGHTAIAALPYRADVGAPPGVEVISFPRLLTRAAGHGVDPYALRRPDFHVLIAVRSGTLHCSLDFAHHELDPGSWLWARPGQVYRYASPLDQAEGRIVLFLPDFLDGVAAQIADIDRGTWQPSSVLAGAEREDLWLLLEVLEREYVRWAANPSDVQLELLRHMLAVVALRLAGLQDAPVERSEVGDAFLRFQAAVERDFTSTHQVEDYAARLGYSVRTLTRATRAAVGCGAKQFINDRVLLEAKRLLVHTDLPSATIGARLGFPGATAFTKFFRHRTELTPLEFRARGA
ncbi:helix-turn-helix domain-containing protein [Streptomyces sp. NPDC001002]